MERHEKVARVHRALSWLYGLLLVVFMFLVFFSGYDSPPGRLYVVFFGIVFVLHYFTARGAWQKKSGARTASQIIAFFMLFGFPIFTVIGIYLLMNAWSPWDAPSDTSTERV